MLFCTCKRLSRMLFLARIKDFNMSKSFSVKDPIFSKVVNGHKVLHKVPAKLIKRCVRHEISTKEPETNNFLSPCPSSETMCGSKIYRR